MRGDPEFETWKERARSRDIVEVAHELGAKLRRAGREHVGPCPVDGGTDRFAINVSKRVFICRGSAAGDVIRLVEHVRGLDFIGACEFLTGEPPPTGRRDETVEQRQAREREYQERLASGERRRNREALREERRERGAREFAFDIWTKRGIPISGTRSQDYLCNDRGLGDTVDPGFPNLRHVEDLEYTTSGLTFPALICRVVSAESRFLGIWRVFLDPEHGKAPVDSPKMGLGPCAGGAVWFGKPCGRVNVCEGVETALAVRALTGGEPVAAALSTSGMRGLVLPEGVESVLIWPDGDTEKIRKVGDGNRVLPSPGMSAADDLKARLKSEGRRCSVQPMPLNGHDWLDVFVSTKGRAA